MSTPWLEEGKKYLGFEENKNSIEIKGWAKKLGPKWFSDSFNPTINAGAWCGVYVAYCLNQVGIKPPENYFRARDWMEFGQPLTIAQEGAVGIFAREGGGHVGFILGKTPDGHLVVRGGNQGNRVSDVKFPLARLIGIRWPKGVPTLNQDLKVQSVVGGFSASEA
jgi:uncharacterized protein (TIGR02594 family)